MTQAPHACTTVESVTASVYQIPTDQPEADGTLALSATTLVVAQVHAAGQAGLGYTYAAVAARNLQVSGHCAPNLHAHVAAAVPNLRHLEYFHDHVRIEGMLFDGALDPHGGVLRPDQSRPGLGLGLKETDADRYRRA